MMIDKRGIILSVCTGLIVLGSLLVSCGKKANIQAANNDASVDSTKLEELFVWVDNARVRKEAEPNAELVTEIKGGEKVILTGESSADKIKVNLRGVDFEDVWVKIKTADGKEGWIFKAMLTDNEEKATAMNDLLIVPGESAGRVKVGVKQLEVESIFGKEFITKGIIYDGEGLEWPGFYVFKNSPFELQCVVKESDNTIDNIKIRQPGANWQTAEGIKIGTTIDEVQKMNGRDMIIEGFGSSEGGGSWIHDYSGGKLKSYQGRIGICFGEPDDLTGMDYYMQSTLVGTQNKTIFGRGVKVAEIVIYPSMIM